MKLVPFTKDNRDTYLKLASSFYDSPAVLSEADPEIFNRNFEHILSHDDAMGFFLSLDDVKIGYVLCAKMFSTEVGAPSLWIEELTIETGHQGKGYGSQTFALIHEMYPEVKRFRLEVSKENAYAKRLYERLGYKDLAYEQMIYDR